jgi:hypothetical protein
MKLEFNIVPAHVLQTYVQTLYKNISRKPLDDVDVGDNLELGRNSTRVYISMKYDSISNWIFN